MKKTLCDRCGKEIEIKDEHWTLEFRVANDDDPINHDYALWTHDLCPPCVDALRKQLEFNK